MVFAFAGDSTMTKFPPILLLFSISDCKENQKLGKIQNLIVNFALIK